MNNNTILNIMHNYREYAEVIDTTGNKSLKRLSYCNKDQLCDQTNDLYTMFDHDFLFKKNKEVAFIKSSFFKFLRFNLIIDKLNKGKETNLLISSSTLFELIIQLKYLKLNVALDFIFEHYLRIIDNNILFFDDRILDFIEYNILKEEKSLSSYLKLNSRFSNNSKQQLTIKYFENDFPDYLILVLYYLLLSNDHNKVFSCIFPQLDNDLKNCKASLKKFELSQLFSSINEFYDISIFFKI